MIFVVVDLNILCEINLFNFFSFQIIFIKQLKYVAYSLLENQSDVITARQIWIFFPAHISSNKDARCQTL